MELKVVEFSREHLPSVQGFECGSTLWAELAADWIANAPPFPCALQSMDEYGTEVWLYFLVVPELGKEYLVGFSSLGPAKASPEMGYIPMLAVASAFQGKPEDSEGGRFSHRIMKHVLATARERGFRDVCLLVHDDNVRAKRLYTRFGFAVATKKDKKGNVRMDKSLA